MFKPSMAELGLCMYQVIVVAKYRTNIKSGEMMFVDFWFLYVKRHLHKSIKNVCTKIDHFNFSQLDTLVQEHIPDLYVHFQSQVGSMKIIAKAPILNICARFVGN